MKYVSGIRIVLREKFQQQALRTKSALNETLLTHQVPCSGCPGALPREDGRGALDADGHLPLDRVVTAGRPAGGRLRTVASDPLNKHGDGGSYALMHQLIEHRVKT